MAPLAAPFGEEYRATEVPVPLGTRDSDHYETPGSPPFQEVYGKAQASSLSSGSLSSGTPAAAPSPWAKT
jgi:hypothetical protein